MRWEPQRSEELRKAVRELVNEDPFRCYQCGKCTAGCPMASEMEHPPHKIMRLLQLGDLSGAVESAWVCVSCETCTARCPQGIDVARVMDGVRQLGLSRGVFPREGAAVFAQVFLEQVKNYGRLWEPLLGAKYNLRTLNPFKDAGLALKLLQKGRIPFSPDRIEGKGELERIFSVLGQKRGEG